MSGVPHTALSCKDPLHDHWGQVEFAENAGLPAPESDELVCVTCERKVYWDEGQLRYRHLTDAAVGCFLIAGEETK